MRYLTNGSRYARFTDEDTCEVWDDHRGWCFPIPADIARFGPDWRACEDPRLQTEGFRVKWSPEDGMYVGLCDRYPSLSWLEATGDGALAGIRRLVQLAEADIAETGE